MADTKISALTVATTPLAGTEVLPIVQSGVTKQVSVANLTAGRAVSADSLTLTGSPLPATSGGTGQSSYAVGDLLYASTTTALSKLADVATGNALISGGVGVAPSWGKVGLTTHVSGVLPSANGGTNTSTVFTAGSVVFAGGGGGYNQDNANFFWDDTNNRLGLGNAAPKAILDIKHISGRWQTFKYDTNIAISAENDAGSPESQRFYAENTYWYAGTTAAGLALKLTLTNSSGDLKLESGNFVQGTAAKGINFTANTGAAGKTSQLLNWYEEGTWTPTATAQTGTITAYTSSGRYVRIGRMVNVFGEIVITTAGTAAGRLNFGGLPFTTDGGQYTGVARERAGTGNIYFTATDASAATTGRIQSSTNGAIDWTGGNTYVFTFSYQV